jgi:hypothetical protein
MSIIKIFISTVMVFLLTNVSAVSQEPEIVAFNPMIFFNNQCGKAPAMISINPLQNLDKSKTYLNFNVASVKREINFPHDDVYTASAISFYFTLAGYTLELHFPGLKNPGSNGMPLWVFHTGSETVCGVRYGHIFHQNGKPLLFLGTGSNSDPIGNIFNGLSMEDFILESAIKWASAEQGFELFAMNPLQTVETVSLWNVPLRSPTKPNFRQFCFQVLGRPNTNLQEEQIIKNGVAIDSHSSWAIQYYAKDGATILYDGERVLSEDYERLFGNGFMASSTPKLTSYKTLIIRTCIKYGVDEKTADALIENIGDKWSLVGLSSLILG